MNPLILFYSVVMNLLALGLYLLFWYVLPAAAVVLILFLVVRALMWLIGRIRLPSSRGSGPA